MINETFISPPPSSNDLKAARYEYNSFPKLQDSLFGKIRFVKPLLNDAKKFKPQSSKVNDSTLIVHGGNKDWSEAMRSVVIIQTRYRGYHARKIYNQMKRNAAARILQSLIQSTLAHRRKQYELSVIRRLQGVVTGRKQVRKDRHYFLRCRKATKTLQANVRMFLSFSMKQRKQQCIQIFQASIAGTLAVQRRTQFRQGCEWMNRRLQLSLARQEYLRRRALMIRLQATYRGILLRRKEKEKLKEKHIVFKKEVFDLWMTQKVSLIYRSKFSLSFEDLNYLNCGLWEAESVKLKKKKRKKEKI